MLNSGMEDVAKVSIESIYIDLILNNGGDYSYKAECKYYKPSQCKNDAPTSKNQEVVGERVGGSVSVLMESINAA